MVRKHYIDSIKRFREDFFKENRNLFKQLEDGQSPDTMIITCSDSRIVPHIKMGAFPGDIFLFRNMGNFVPPFRKGEDDPTGVGAFLEYGSQVKKSEAVEKSAFIKGWLRNGEALKRIVIDTFGQEDEEKSAERGFEENVRIQVANAKTYPFIRDAFQDKRLTIHGWLYDVKSAGMCFLDGESGEFRPLT
jgi:carbonic anhydrase